MNIAEPFIRRPVMTTLVMISFLFFGILAYQRLPVNDLPTVDYPTITVSASLPGASPETMAAAVATPLEQQFSTIAGIDNMTSTSTLGSTSITIQFSLDRAIDAAAQDVQAAISKTLRTLPQGIIPPSYQKVNPADSPILYMVLTSDQLSLSALNEYAETFLGQRLSTVSGVAQVSVYGSQKYAVRVQLDPQALATRGIGIDEVATAISNENVNLPTGVLWGTDKAYTVQASGQLQDAQAFRQLTVAYRNGAPVRLAELGQVLDDVQNNRVASWFNNSRALVLAIQRQPGTNTVAVAQGVRKELAALAPQLPASVRLQTMYDRSQSIEESVHDVKFTLVLTIFLVVLVIFVFLRNVSATVIPSLVLPLSIVGTFAVMWVFDFSLDNLSLMALTLAVGFVVDDAIVMLENIVRHQEMGEDAMTAALNGSREIGFTILSMTVSLTAVFIPLLFMPGIIGRLFREFAVTISAAILVSGVVSLTLTPMLASRFLHREHEKEKKHGRMYEASERVFNGALGAYERALAWVMNRRRLSLAFSLLILVGTVLLFEAVPKGFIPSTDTGQVGGTTETAQGTSFEAMAQHQAQVQAIVSRDSNVAGVMSAIGSGGPNATGNQGRLFVSLKPRGERLPADQIIQELRPKLAAVPGITVYLQNPPAIRIGGQNTKSLYQYQIQGSDVTTLYPAAQKLEQEMKALPELQDVTSNLQITNPQVNVTIDRDRAAALGVTASQIENALYNAYGSRQASTIYTPTNQYWVVLELLPQYQRDVDALGMLYVRSSSGTLVPLSSVARLTRTVGPQQVNHAGQMPSVTLSFNTKPGVSLGAATQSVSTVAARTLPANVTTSFAGNAQAFQETQSGLLFLLVIAIFVIYMVLGILYENFIHPVTILTGLPFAAFGALLTLWLFRVELDVYGYVGIIMLIGIVKKNAIMMIDFAIEAEKHGKSPRDSIVEAASVRFRPIMMTTVAALMGTLPIAIGFGAGAEARRPLGLVVVGGLAFSQVVTLFVTPVFYTYFDELQHWLGERRRRKSRGVPGGVQPVPAQGD